VALEFDQLLFMGAVTAAVYLAGYQGIAIGIFIIMIFSSLVSGAKKAEAVPAGGVSVHGAQMLEPIVIETTRGPPFRIPSDMKIRIKADWSGRTWYEKAASGVGSATRMMYRPFYPPGFGTEVSPGRQASASF
jgi:hypothetical protein